MDVVTLLVCAAIYAAKAVWSAMKFMAGVLVMAVLLCIPMFVFRFARRVRNWMTTKGRSK